MELMGNDEILSEDALEGMWADGMEQAKCPNARITYDDFLLLMKGQSTEAPPLDNLENSFSRLQAAKLLAVPEGETGFKESMSEETTDEKRESIVLSSGDVVNPDGSIIAASAPIPIPVLAPIRRSLVPRSESPVLKSHSAPVSPAKGLDGIPVMDGVELESPLSMDDDDDIIMPLENRYRDLTPPQTPTRGAEDYITPLSGRRQVDLNMSNIESIAVPGLPAKVPTLYVRRRSRSVDDKDKEDGEEEKEPVFNQDSRRAMNLPEHQHHKEIEALVRDESKSALVVNRKLYRAHRQMRLAVLEASKRFEEQQAEHAKEVLMAQNEREENAAEGPNMAFHAGLVMKHGHKKHVTSEAIKKMLQDNQVEQQALVEKATRRGGRGRRTRKKTISDMSGMLTSMGQDDLTQIAVAAAAASPSGSTGSQSAEFSREAMGGSDRILKNRDSKTDVVPTVPEEELLDHQMREPTVPGNFRKTHDPFGAEGQVRARILELCRTKNCLCFLLLTGEFVHSPTSQYGHLKRNSYLL